MKTKTCDVSYSWTALEPGDKVMFLRENDMTEMDGVKSGVAYTVVSFEDPPYPFESPGIVSISLEDGTLSTGWYADIFKVVESRPIVVCLCGSTRFGYAFERRNLEETLAGKIVLSIGCNMRDDTELFGHLPTSELDDIKAKLDQLHLCKIDLCDEVLVLNVDGYIGESTRREVWYARHIGKRVRWLENAEYLMPGETVG